MSKVGVIAELALAEAIGVVVGIGLFGYVNNESYDQQIWCWNDCCNLLEPSIEKRMMAITHLVSVSPVYSSI